MVGYERLIRYSEDISMEDLSRKGNKEEFANKLRGNELRKTLRLLRQYYIRNPTIKHSGVPSTSESQSNTRKDIAADFPNSMPTVSASQTSNDSLPRHPTGMSSTPKKRIHSGNSMGTHSTHTSPKRFITAEATVQQMQNRFVEDILDILYESDEVPIPWARGRDMSLIYIPYVPGRCG